jgi:mannose-6-phosphate isomerase
LSIQAHPNRDQAREGYAKENRLKIPLKAANRNYRDENHKPEIICALTSFWALKGFRKVEEILFFMDKIGITTLDGELKALQERPNREGLKTFFKALITLDAERRMRIIIEVSTRYKALIDDHPELEWVGKLTESYPDDIGILSPIILNPVHLQPGTAMNIPAGELHVYLGGAGIELMANSDNVLRGGLTPKHVDVQELLNILTFKTGEIDLLKPKQQKGGEKVYATATDEYTLSLLDIHKDILFKSPTQRSVEIMICIDGKAQITDTGTGEALSLKKGVSFIVPASVKQYQIEGLATIYKASVPLSSSDP